MSSDASESLVMAAVTCQSANLVDLSAAFSARSASIDIGSIHPRDLHLLSMQYLMEGCGLMMAREGLWLLRRGLIAPGRASGGEGDLRVWPGTLTSGQS